MKKVINIILILSLMIIGGCEKNNINQNKTNKELTLEQYIISQGFKKKDFICDIPVNNIKDIVKQSEGVKNYILTNDNQVYEYSLEKLFSTTNTNCSIVNTNEIEIVSFINGNRAPMDSSGKQYYNSFTIPDIQILSNEQQLEEKYPGYENYLYNLNNSFAIKENHLYKITDNSINEINFENNEKINTLLKRIEFKNNDLYTILTIVTDSSFYECKEEVTNKECEQYEDIECKTDFVCNLNELTKYKNDIAIFTGEILITNDYNFYIKE